MKQPIASKMYKVLRANHKYKYELNIWNVQYFGVVPIASNKCKVLIVSNKHAVFITSKKYGVLIVRNKSKVLIKQ